MIDWHTHLLPCMDDGSKSIEESIGLLSLEKMQGADTVIATPHFFANDESVDCFLTRRDESLEKLKSEIDDELPKILCGAEVKYYQGISKMDDLKKLTIDGTDLLLLEMNMSRWTEYTVRELTEMATAGYVKVVLAHIDRFIKFQSPEIWQRLYESDILMQVNASYFNDFFSRRKAVEMLFRGGIHFIGSDCHSVKHRPPTIGNAYDYITKKLGEDFVSRFNEYGYSLLSK